MAARTIDPTLKKSLLDLLRPLVKRLVIGREPIGQLVKARAPVLVVPLREQRRTHEVVIGILAGRLLAHKAESRELGNQTPVFAVVAAGHAVGRRVTEDADDRRIEAARNGTVVNGVGDLGLLGADALEEVVQHLALGIGRGLEAMHEIVDRVASGGDRLLVSHVFNPSRLAKHRPIAERRESARCS